MNINELVISSPNSDLPRHYQEKLNGPLKATAGEWNQDTSHKQSTASSSSYQKDQNNKLPNTQSSFEALDLVTKSTHENYWEKIVQARLANYGPKDHRTAEAYFNKGTAYMKIHFYESAFTDFSIAASILGQIHGPNHLSVAKCFHHQGRAAYKNDNMAIALSAFKAAFKIRDEKLGLHIDCVDTCSHIGNVYYRRNDLPNALQSCKEVLTANLELHGEEHPDVAAAAKSLAKVYVKMKKNEEALKFYKRAQRIYEKLGNHRKAAQVEKAMRRIDPEPVDHRFL